MEHPTSQADHLKQWQLRLRALEANAQDLQHLEIGREKLQSVEGRAQIALQTQSAATATKQEASKQVESLIAEGRLVMSYLNAGLREHYGKYNEKLTEFGLMPFRGKKKKVAPPPPPETPAS